MRFNLLFMIVSLIALSGCLPSSQPEIPAWVETPPPATDTELYGVSVAATPGEALVSAAGGVAAGILEAAEPQIKERCDSADACKRVENEAKTFLSTLDYSQTVLKENVPMEDKTAVLVGMPRVAFTEQVATKLDRNAHTLEETLAKVSGAPALVRLGTLGKSYEDLPGLLAEISVLKTLDPAANTTAYDALAARVVHDYNAIKFDLGVAVISDPNAIVFAEPMKNAFISEGIRPTGEKAGTILLFADSRQEQRGGRYSIETRLRLVSTLHGETVAEKEHFLSASSKEGYADAKRQCADALVNIINEKGLFNTLGF